MQARPPERDEFEISIFGPGRGECLVLHLGCGDWIVVDSCIDSRTGRPVAIPYLESLGVDIRTAVKSVVVTHWHDDHMRGAAEIVRHAESAGFVCSQALSEREFCQLIAQSRRSLIPDPGMAEFGAVLDILKERSPHGVRIEA